MEFDLVFLIQRNIRFFIAKLTLTKSQQKYMLLSGRVMCTPILCFKRKIDLLVKDSCYLMFFGNHSRQHKRRGIFLKENESQLLYLI